jgi:hypothetical protein
MKITKMKILAIGYAGWCGLGFIRGLNSYKYNHNKNGKFESYMYVKSFVNGLYGFFIYSNPVFLPYLMYKELYRLEIDLRNLENENNSDLYNDLL